MMNNDKENLDPILSKENHVNFSTKNKYARPSYLIDGDGEAYIPLNQQELFGFSDFETEVLEAVETKKKIRKRARPATIENLKTPAKIKKKRRPYTDGDFGGSIEEMEKRIKLFISKELEMKNQVRALQTKVKEQAVKIGELKKKVGMFEEAKKHYDAFQRCFSNLG